MSTAFDRPELPPLGIVAALEDDDRRLLSDYGEFLPVPEGNSIVEEGSDQDALIFLISGILHVVTDRSGTRVLLARVHPGETVGEVNLFDPGKASATVVAKSFSQIWKATRRDLDDFRTAYANPANQLMIGLLSEMSRRLRAMNARLSTAEMRTSLQMFFH